MMTTFEHMILTEQDFSNLNDFVWLMEQNFDGFFLQRKNQQWQIKFSHYIGVIALPSGEQLEILPKISQNTDVFTTRQWVQQMLIDIWHTLTPKDLASFSYQNLIPNKNLNINQWFNEIFLQQFSHYQPNQHYQRYEQNQTFLQGKLLIKQQVQQNYHQPHKFFQQTEQFVYDTACNCLIKATIKQLFDRHFLHHLPAFWQMIRDITPRDYQSYFYQAKQELHALPSMIAKQNSDFLDFCYIILTLQQASQQGEFATPTLWINMQFAFEKWVFYQIKQQFNQSGDEVVAQKSQALIMDNLLVMKPDIWVKTADKIIVMDVKWKMIADISQIKLADMYQILTYAEQFNATQAWLIVPTDDKNKAKQHIKLINSTKFEVFFVPFCVI